MYTSFIVCSYSVLPSSPTPTIKWFKKGGDLPVQKVRFENYNKTLRIVNISEEDVGEYVCMANNHLGSIRHSIFVEVKGKEPFGELFPARDFYHANLTSYVSQRLLIGWTNPQTWFWPQKTMAAWCVGPMGTPNPPFSGSSTES